MVERVASLEQLLAQPAIVAAIIAGAVAGIGVVLNFAFGLLLQMQRQGFDKEIAERRLKGDLSLAREKTTLDREMEVWRRKALFAEECLEGFYEARSLFRLIRSPFSFQYEAEQRQGRDEESEALRRTRDTYYPVLKRLDENIEQFSKLHSKRFRAALLFGPEAETPFNELRAIHAKIQTAAQALMRQDTHSEHGSAPEFKAQMESLVWDGMRDPDPLNPKIDECIARAEAALGPVLKTGA